MFGWFCQWRMIQFGEVFPAERIVASLTRQLSNLSPEFVRRAAFEFQKIFAKKE
jgi:hypothetical protein